MLETIYFMITAICFSFGLMGLYSGGLREIPFILLAIGCVLMFFGLHATQDEIAHNRELLYTFCDDNNLTYMPSPHNSNYQVHTDGIHITCTNITERGQLIAEIKFITSEEKMREEYGWKKPKIFNGDE